MAEISLRKRVWGWFFFDWASQPYNTLLITFVFAPYVAEVLGEGTTAQTAWGFGIGAAGIVIALLAPFLGAIADSTGRRMVWIWLFSALYVLGSAMLWFAEPADFDLYRTLFFFAIGLIGMEFATIFTNALLPDLGPREEIGKISGNGWAFGYCGGLVALVIMLLLLAENAETGKTLLGIDPIFGLDASAREGTRAVGPLTAIWYVVFMVPFFLWVRENPYVRGNHPRPSVPAILGDLKRTVLRLPQTPSLFAYLMSSMFYRDALNGMYAFGGIYAAGVLGWTTIDVGIFGILAIISGAIFAVIGGRADSAFGPRPVIMISLVALTLIAIGVVMVSRTSVFGVPVAEGSIAPDVAFYILGSGIGAAGGVLGAASRTMLVRQANPARMTEAFGLYALTGKATAFLAPMLIGVVTYASGSQQVGVSPLIGLFLLGILLLLWVKPEGGRAATWSEPSSS